MQTKELSNPPTTRIIPYALGGALLPKETSSQPHSFLRVVKKKRINALTRPYSPDQWKKGRNRYTQTHTHNRDIDLAEVTWAHLAILFVHLAHVGWTGPVWITAFSTTFCITCGCICLCLWRNSKRATFMLTLFLISCLADPLRLFFWQPGFDCLLVHIYNSTAFSHETQN